MDQHSRMKSFLFPQPEYAQKTMHSTQLISGTEASFCFAFSTLMVNCIYTMATLFLYGS